MTGEGRGERRLKLARAGEEAAVRHLEAAGLRIEARNWRCTLGELDIVAIDGAGVVVVVEVKTRQDGQFGHPAEAIDSRKRDRLRRLAWRFLQERRWVGRAVRFDVAAVWPNGPGRWRVEWIQDAFGT